MSKTLVLAIAVCATIFGAQPSHAQQLLESYKAVLSERDHFSSSGQRLTTAAAVIRQDRANYHRFGFRDQGDESDTFFADSANRAALERLLERGRAEPGVISRIVNGTPTVRIEVWRGNSGPFVVVTLLDGAKGTSSPEQKPSEVQGSSLDNSYYYVANTRPPDDFLALRTYPTSRVGLRIMAMRNGTHLQVLQRRTDGWWYVRVVPSGEEGWALSGQGNLIWIECCVRASTNRVLSEEPQIVDLLKAPGNASAKRTCTIKIDTQDHFCTAAWFILYKEGVHAVQFNRGTEDNSVIAFIGTAVDADTISINRVTVRIGNSSSTEEDKTVGQCVLGRTVAACQARMSNGRMLIGNIVSDP